MMNRLKYFNNGHIAPRGGIIQQPYMRMSSGIGYHPIFGYGVYGGTHTSNYDDLQENVSDFFADDFVGYDQAIQDNINALADNPNKRESYLAEIELLKQMKEGNVPKYSTRFIDADFIDDDDVEVVKQLQPNINK